MPEPNLHIKLQKKKNIYQERKNFKLLIDSVLTNITRIKKKNVT